ncbi:threonine--tRNA ligase, mitochondrial 1-like isoform X1 [Vigna angularis]|uniref:threonine--tRNA ligase, mitochondrial 1-like isoform X1 n=1 Tax=Phaseolus angularis TaxID=3914 RepID=UPI0022B4DEE5|nr:threonine--tRNA ligase, mitochondrial 1-like isoform X1 [Vigna angularis]
MIHRVILGSVEHMFAILLEHYKGKWPFWLSPLQAIVREAQLAQYKYMLVVGEEEANTGQVVWPSEVVVVDLLCFHKVGTTKISYRNLLVALSVLIFVFPSCLMI